MGLLDDAIKEHLELKRRRGADPSEIARQEAEALGPVRREPAETEPEAHAAEAAAPEPAGLDEPGAAYAEEPAYEPMLPAEPVHAPEPSADADRPRRDDGPVTHADPYPEDEHDTASPPHGDPLAHQATREFSAAERDDALGTRTEPQGSSEIAPGDEDDEHDDVLEETPEFLQETPEHDRLWFEQKPPKDFDF